MENDFAVVVGLQDYPGMDDPQNNKPPLTGAVNDATSFRDWLVSPQGGDVPEQNVALIVSSSTNVVPKNLFWQATPNATDIIKAFTKLQQASLK